MKNSQNPPPSSSKPGATSDVPDAIVHWRIDQWFPDLSADVRAKLKLFHGELITANRTLSLIGARTTAVSDALHFADSILASKAIAKAASPAEIYDFGTGGGLPGLIYAVCYSGTKVHLVENDVKKAEFLKQMVTSLNLKNVTLHVKNVEALEERSVNFAMSRGLGPIAKTLLMARKCVTKGGIFFHLKGDEWATEVGQIPTQLCSFWLPALVEEYRLPVGEFRFAVVKTEKIAD